MIIVKCANCNKEIKKSPYEIKKSKKGIFVCSKKCYASYSSKIKVNCKYCGKERKVWPYTYKRSKNFFCNRKCHYLYGQPTLIGLHRSEETKKKISEKNKGNIMPEYQKEAISKRMKQAAIDWRNGKPSNFFLNSLDFPTEEKYNKGHEKIRAIIRKRDNYRCQECFRHQSELEYTLPVHHIDYDKKNDDSNNLITLCRNCHAQTNFKRDNWQKYYKKRIRGEL